MAENSNTVTEDVPLEQEPGLGGPSQDVPDNEAPPSQNGDDASSDYSDVASVDSQNPTSPRRRHQRGGRKGRRKQGRKLQSVSEFAVPSPTGSETQDQATQTGTDSKVGSGAEDYDEEELQKARSSRAPSAKKDKTREKSKKRDTGVKAFNMKRAESSGGRPMGITIERPKAPGKSKGKQKGKKKGKATKKAEKKAEKGEEKDGENDEDYEDEDEDEETETETETRKPVSIRLDLNLEVEIFLRAKIKGDVTITFL
jgi:hypothetical protein